MQQIKWIFILFILWVGQQAVAQMPVKNQVQDLMNPFDKLPSVRAIYSYVENGGHINKRGYNDESFLHIAAYFNDISLASFLLKHRPRTDLVDEEGWTPLHIAAYMSHQDFANFLLQHGADINKKDFLGQTPLHVATYKEHADFVAFLIQQGVSVDEVDGMGQSPLFLAASKGNKRIALMLLDAEASVHQREKNHNWTSLHAAVHGRNKEIVSLFLERGADPNVTDDSDRTPLVFALYKMRMEIANFLAKQKDVNVHTPDKNGVRPVDFAAFIGDPHLLSALLDRKALVHPSYSQTSKDTSSDMLSQEFIFSSVYWALYGYNPTESFALIQQAINNYLSRFAITDMTLTLSADDPSYEIDLTSKELIKLIKSVNTLISNITITQSEITQADIQSWQSWIDWILHGGYTYLIQARAMYETLEELIDQVSVIHQETGQTYLHSALHRRSDPLFIEHGLKDPKEQIDFLMEEGFDIKSIDDEGRTPLHWTLYGADPELVSFFKSKYYDPIIESIVSKEKTIINNSCENTLL